MYLALHCAGRAKALAPVPPAPRASSPYHAHRDATQGYGNMCPYGRLQRKIKVKKKHIQVVRCLFKTTWM